MELTIRLLDTPDDVDSVAGIDLVRQTPAKTIAYLLIQAQNMVDYMEETHRRLAGENLMLEILIDGKVVATIDNKEPWQPSEIKACVFDNIADAFRMAWGDL